MRFCKKQSPGDYSTGQLKNRSKTMNKIVSVAKATVYLKIPVVVELEKESYSQSGESAEFTDSEIIEEAIVEFAEKYPVFSGIDLTAYKKYFEVLDVEYEVWDVEYTE